MQCTVSQTENQIIFKELFASYVEIDTNKIMLVSENYKNLFDSKTDTMLCTILGKEKRNDKLYAITSIVPIGDNDFATSPLLGIAEFKVKNNKIQQFLNYSQYVKEGNWGEVPPFELKFIDKNKKIILIISKGFTNQGITTENILGYMNINKQVKKVLEINSSYEDNKGNCDKEEGNCYKYNTELSFSNDTLIAIKKGTYFNIKKDSLVMLNEKKLYIYQDGIDKYLEID
ncbi:hypothetical protein JXB41_05960 [Candidatus Woesearchaeota archaeon]|nr:hypothetical protein [Candidatus Woesearchaeota archaeon]